MIVPDPAGAAAADRRRTRFRRVAPVVVGWVSAVALWTWYQRHLGTGPTGALQWLIDAAQGNWWAVAVYSLVAVARPFVLFPATLVTVAAGMLFGAVPGVAIAAGTANLSALVGFSVGRSFHRGSTTDDRADSLVGSWRSRLQTNGFEAVLLMRLLFLPYDVVNYVCGALGVRRRASMTATAIGSLPGTISFVLLGASIDRLDNGIEGLDPTTLVASVVLITASLGLSMWLKRRQKHVPDMEPGEAGSPTGASGFSHRSE